MSVEEFRGMVDEAADLIGCPALLISLLDAVGITY